MAGAGKWHKNVFRFEMFSPFVSGWTRKKYFRSKNNFRSKLFFSFEIFSRSNCFAFVSGRTRKKQLRTKNNFKRNVFTKEKPFGSKKQKLHFRTRCIVFCRFVTVSQQNSTVSFAILPSYSTSGVARTAVSPRVHKVFP